MRHWSSWYCQGSPWDKQRAQQACDCDTVQDGVCHTACSIKIWEACCYVNLFGQLGTPPVHSFALLLMNQPLLLTYLPSLFTWKPRASGTGPSPWITMTYFRCTSSFSHIYRGGVQVRRSVSKRHFQESVPNNIRLFPFWDLTFHGASASTQQKMPARARAGIHPPCSKALLWTQPLSVRLLVSICMNNIVFLQGLII